MMVFEHPGDRVIVLLSSGNVAGTQAVIGVLKQRAGAEADDLTIWTAPTMFDVANRVADAVRDIERRDGEYLAQGPIKFRVVHSWWPDQGRGAAAFSHLCRGQLLEAGCETPFLQAGETKCGKHDLSIG